MIKTKKLLLGASRLRQIMAYCQFFLLMPTMYLTNIPMFECVVSMSINFLKLSGGAGGWSSSNFIATFITCQRLQPPVFDGGCLHSIQHLLDRTFIRSFLPSCWLIALFVMMIVAGRNMDRTGRSLL